MIPARDPNVVDRRLADDTTALLAKDGTELYVLNVTGSVAWELMDGERTVDDIAHIIASTMQVPAAEVVADVRQLVSELRARGALA